MPRRPTTWLLVSGHRFLLRRIESALLGGDPHAPGLRARTGALTVGCVVAALAIAGCAIIAVARPRVALDHAQFVMGRESGALYVRVSDTWHPVLNLASARLIAAAAVNPQPVPDADLGRTKRGPLLGIPGAPQILGKPLPADELAWTICDTHASGATTVVVGPIRDAPAHRLSSGQAALVAPATGSPTYLLYDGQRAVVDVADAAVVRALGLEGRTPRAVSQSLLSAIPEAPTIRAPRIRGAGQPAPALPGFPVGSVVRITRAAGDQHYVVLADGVQRIGQVAADLLRLGHAQGTANTPTVSPDAIGAAPIVDSLPVDTFPERTPAVWDDGGTLCVSRQDTRSAPAGVSFLAGDLPLPHGQSPVTLSQADGRGPALDAVYVPPGRSAFVRADATRYLVTDAGVRFAVHDDEAAQALGLAAAEPAPWSILGAIPAGPELSRERASMARDTVVGPP